MENLNKENFWNRIYETYPEACQEFCDWIDKYKAENNWNVLFNSDSNWQDKDGKNATAPKYHDLPIAMQTGIFIEFCRVKGGCHWDVDLMEFDLAEEIENWMKYRQDVINDNF